jgi:hypothetical protein
MVKRSRPLLILGLFLLFACSTTDESLPPVLLSSVTLTQPATFVPSQTATSTPSLTHTSSPTLRTTPSPSRRPPDTSLPTSTLRKTSTATTQATITPTFDASSLITRTPAQPAQCPEEKPELVPTFNYDDDNWMLVWKQILEALNHGVTRKAIISVYSQHYPTFARRWILEKDVTGDDIPELLFTFMPESFIAYLCKDGQYQAVQLPVNSYHFLQPTIITIKDMNRDGVDEIIARAGDDRIRVFTVYEWDGNKFVELNEKSDCMVLYGPSTVKALDVNGDYIQELVLKQEIPIWSEYTYGLPWRKETRICSWNGASFVLTSTEYAQPEYRFQAVQDGDRATLAGDYGKALNFYQQAIFSDTLDWWSNERSWYESNVYVKEFVINPTLDSSLTPDPAEYPNLTAYSRYRIMLLHIVRDYLPEAKIVYDTLQAKIPNGQVGHAYAEMAEVFWNEYQKSSDLKQACSETVKYATSYAEDILSYLGNSKFSKAYYGDQSLEYQPEDICPFR